MPSQDDWTPFNGEVQFWLADLLYHQATLSFSTLNDLLEIWSLLMSEFGASSPITTPIEMHTLIDASTLSDTRWQCLVMKFPEIGNKAVLIWMHTEYEVWYFNPNTVMSQMLSNPEFDGQFDLYPYIDLDEHGTQCWNNIMSRNVAWQHSVSGCSLPLIHTCY
jgi:hypothetical protein